jgi:hypothetical protein
VSQVRSGIVCLNGFRRDGGPSSGLYGLYSHIYDTWYDRASELILHRTWASDPDETADLLLFHRPARLYVIAYSYGAGEALTGLARELAERGRRIDAAFLIDPVTRYRFAKWKSLIRGRGNSYSLPPSVDRAYAWRQVNKFKLTDPVGQPVVASTDTQAIGPEVVLGTPENLERHARHISADRRIQDFAVDHSSIDGHPDVHDQILAHLRQLVPPPQRSAAA